MFYSVPIIAALWIVWNRNGLERILNVHMYFPATYIIACSRIFSCMHNLMWNDTETGWHRQRLYIIMRLVMMNTYIYKFPWTPLRRINVFAELWTGCNFVLIVFNNRLYFANFFDRAVCLQKWHLQYSISIV